MKKYLPAFLYTITICILGTFVASVLYYFNIYGEKINTIILYLVSIVAMFVGSYIVGKKTNKKAIIGGSIYFSIYFIIMLLLSFLIFKASFKISSLIYFLILYIFSILGSIIGKNSKEQADTN